MQDEDGKKEMMTATHEGKTYVASVSLEDQMYQLRQALKYTRWMMWAVLAGVAAASIIGAFLFWLKYDAIVAIIGRLLG